jgi:competence protein ComEC
LPVLSVAQGMVLSVGACVLLFSQRFRIRGLLLMLLACAACEWQLRHQEQPIEHLRATFLDVGQGDAALLDLPDGTAMLIDAGGNPQGGPDPGERVLVPLLAARRREHIQTLVLTHPHPDHYGGLEAVLGKLRVTELWDSGQATREWQHSGTSERARELLQRAAERGARVLGPEQLCGRARTFGQAQVRVLSPCPSFDPGYDPNDNSLVLHVSYAGRSILFAGDIEAYAEDRLVRSQQLRADVLKVAHHGSRTSSSEAFVRAVQPRIAVVSAGAANTFGHPHPEVMERLRRQVPQVIDLGERGGTIVDVAASGQLSVHTTEP